MIDAMIGGQPVQPPTRRFTLLFALFGFYCAVVALRALFLAPPLPGKVPLWFLGVVAAAAACFTAGYIYRGGREQRHRQRADDRRARG